MFRHLTGEISQEWADFTGEDPKEQELKDKLVELAKQIVPYNMAHNAEAEACDLLMEIERMDLLEQDVDENNYQRVCLYLTRFVEPPNWSSNQFNVIGFQLRSICSRSRKYHHSSNCFGVVP